MIYKSIIFVFSITLFLSCGKITGEYEAPMPDLLTTPLHFPEIPFPEENPFTLEKWELGKTLFYDPIMSKDSSVSCASCHQASLAFSDDQALSLGSNLAIGTRNAPSLANIAYHPYYLREGGLPTIEMQALVPIQEHNEFNHNIVDIAEQLNQNTQYINLTEAAFQSESSAFTITRALATFQRTLISGQSRFDFFELGNETALTKSEQNGMKLFFSDKSACSSCHGDFNFTKYAFENNGLYETYDDPGRFRLTSLESDRALFKVPSLRNIELTGPYMHDGSIQTLTEIIEHYNSGGKTHPNKSSLLRPLELTIKEKEDLENFLKALTDENFINNPIFKN